jgi:hypothetical protein
LIIYQRESVRFVWWFSEYREASLSYDMKYVCKTCEKVYMYVRWGWLSKRVSFVSPLSSWAFFAHLFLSFFQKNKKIKNKWCDRNSKRSLIWYSMKEFIQVYMTFFVVALDSIIIIIIIIIIILSFLCLLYFVHTPPTTTCVVVAETTPY